MRLWFKDLYKEETIGYGIGMLCLVTPPKRVGLISRQKPYPIVSSFCGSKSSVGAQIKECKSSKTNAISVSKECHVTNSPIMMRVIKD